MLLKIIVAVLVKQVLRSLVDIASKHALHANCAKTVFYAGEFHPRPIGGWDQYDPNERRSWNQWELVIDNNSGTYAPDSTLLENLKRIINLQFSRIKCYYI